MTPLERAIARQRAALLKIERNGADALVESYQQLEGRLKANLELLTAEIERARGARIEVKPGWLFAQEHYRRLVSELQLATLEFVHRALITVTDGQRQAVRRAPTDAERLIFAAMGPAPESVIESARSRFGKLPGAQLEHLVGRAGDGHPLGELLGEIVPASTTAVKNSLAYGVATGQSPRVIAADVVTQSGMARDRALTIARTEVLGSYRVATKERFKTSRVVQTWTWVSVLDERTCPACAAMNGTQHPIGEGLDSHPACRCAEVPNTPSWSDLGFVGIPDTRPTLPGPEEAFQRLTEGQRLAILGATRLDAYNEGEISLQDLVHDTYSPRWGRGRRMATLTEMGLRA